MHGCTPRDFTVLFFSISPFLIPFLAFKNNISTNINLIFFSAHICSVTLFSFLLWYRYMSISGFFFYFFTSTTELLNLNGEQREVPSSNDDKRKQNARGKCLFRDRVDIPCAWRAWGAETNTQERSPSK